MTTVSARLAKVISDSKMSYADLEKLTNIAKSSIQRYASGRTKKIPIDAVQIIAQATDSSAAWIMGWTEEDDHEENKKNDTISDIILLLRKDDKLLQMFKDICDLTDEQRTALQGIILALKQR